MKRAGGVLLTLGAAWPAAGFLPANRVLPSSPPSTSSLTSHHHCHMLAWTDDRRAEPLRI